MIDAFQYIGSIILIFHKLPQMYRTFKNRDSLKDLSLLKFSMGVVGGLVMLVWGIGTSNWGVVLLNIFCSVYETFNLWFIVRSIRRKKK